MNIPIICELINNNHIIRIPEPDSLNFWRNVQKKINNDAKIIKRELEQFDIDRTPIIKEKFDLINKLKANIIFDNDDFNMRLENCQENRPDTGRTNLKTLFDDLKFTHKKESEINKKIDEIPQINDTESDIDKEIDEILQINDTESDINKEIDEILQINDTDEIHNDKQINDGEETVE
uniref:Uncharacterized protein n=1 Tax=Pseudopediastrum sp. CL0201VA TaxID=2184484 RepID=A0A2U8GJP8_9CHLO|nr:hypothetical protein [Pseudopediastrum sp. CL0201VA]YP_009492299.1 hypothetical protein [Pseudopediastrum sp. CL0201VA]AWI68891.1 hypothetical protein [Pseudopediastrum sp. CL0201VA]AWI68892.1 hypothetical protein [Pseudopediastrum sp. CL0201VA]